jgi:hypothetical protein
MSKYISAFVAASLLLSLGSCFDPPIYPLAPQVSFDGIRFVQIEGQDSLVLSFDFRDGDGDIGLSDDDNTPPFHRVNLILDSTATFVFNEQVGGFVVEDVSTGFVEFGDEGNKNPYYLVSNFGTLVGVYSEDPIVLPDFGCRDYIPVTDVEGDTTGADKQDTLLIEPNEFLNNINITFLRQRNGQLEDITGAFAPDACSDPFDSRIPIFDTDNLGRPLDGTINYPMLSSGFISNFLNDSIIIEFYIYDRALNRSNIERTQPFTLPGLLGIN